MNINFPNISILKYAKTPFCTHSAPLAFRGLNSDTFEKNNEDASSVDWDKKVDEAKKNFEEKMRLRNEVKKQYEAFDPMNIEFDYLGRKMTRPYLKNKLQEANRRAREAQHEITLVEYEKQKHTHPSTAFLYDENLTKVQKMDELKKNPQIVNAGKFAQYDKLAAPYIKVWINKDKIEADYFARNYYVDTEFPKNKEFLEDFKEKTKGKMKLSEYADMYNMNDIYLQNLIRDGKLDFVSEASEDCEISYKDWIIDKDTPNNQKVARDYTKSTPLELKKYSKNNGKKAPLVPAIVLTKLGFAYPRRIAYGVKFGELKGEFKEVKQADGTKKVRCYVDINDKKTEAKLKELRRKNPNVVLLEDVRKAIGITEEQMQERLINDKCEIIRYYLLPYDANKLLVDFLNPKNADLKNEYEQKISLKKGKK